MVGFDLVELFVNMGSSEDIPVFIVRYGCVLERMKLEIIWRCVIELKAKQHVVEVKDCL